MACITLPTYCPGLFKTLRGGDWAQFYIRTAKMCGKLNSITVLLLVAAFCGLGKSGNVFNFTCDLSPEKHDQVLQEAITKLRRGKLILAP